MNAILDYMDGTVPANSEGSLSQVVPALFGANFEAVNGEQKVDAYLDATGAPSSALLEALDFIDSGIGQFVNKLQTKGIFENTVVIITAKHGQTPIDPTQRLIVDSTII